MIARAVAQKPKAILFDEPTAHLDYGNQYIVIRLIRKLAHDGYGIIMTTHNPDHVMLLSGNAAILDRNGHFEAGNTENIVTEASMERLYGAEIVREIKGLRTFY